MENKEKFFKKYKNKLINLSAVLIIVSFPILYIGIKYEILLFQILGFIIIILVMAFALIEPI